MNKYIGVKEIKATPMTRAEYNKYRGWALPADENGSDEGFLVEYIDGGQANHPDHDGYISWSPEDVFTRAYRNVAGMTFGLAVEAMKKGLKVARAGWNGKGMWLRLIDPLRNPYSICTDNNPDAIGTPIDWIGMKTADNKFVPWLASQTDMLAEDWMVVP